MSERWWARAQPTVSWHPGPIMAPSQAQNEERGAFGPAITLINWMINARRHKTNIQFAVGMTDTRPNRALMSRGGRPLMDARGAPPGVTGLSRSVAGGLF